MFGRGPGCGDSLKASCSFRTVSTSPARGDRALLHEAKKCLRWSTTNLHYYAFSADASLVQMPVGTFVEDVSVAFSFAPSGPVSRAGLNTGAPFQRDPSVRAHLVGRGVRYQLVLGTGSDKGCSFARAGRGTTEMQIGCKLVVGAVLGPWASWTRRRCGLACPAVKVDSAW